MNGLVKLTNTICACATALALSATPVLADSEITATYDIEVAGVALMKLSYSALVSDNGYSSNVSVRTKGVAKYLKDYRLGLASQGKRKSGKFLPQTFEREREKKGKSKSYSVAWSGGTPQLEDTSTPQLQHVAKTLKAGASDPLAVMLQVVLGTRDKFCSGKHRVFDGRDVYDIVISSAPAEGTGERCKLTTTTIAGSAYEKSKPTAPVDVYYITFAPENASGFRIPVSISGEADGKSFTANARSVTVNGASLL